MNFTSERMRCFTKHNVYIPLFSVGPQTAAAAEQVVGSVAITRKTLHTAYQTVLFMWNCKNNNIKVLIIDTVFFSFESDHGISVNMHFQVS